MIKKPLTIDEYGNVRDAENQALFCTYSGLSVSRDEINAEIVNTLNSYRDAVKLINEMVDIQNDAKALIRQLVEALERSNRYLENAIGTWDGEALEAIAAARKAGF